MFPSTLSLTWFNPSCSHCVTAVFDKFIEKHLDRESLNIIMHSYEPIVTTPGAFLAAASQAYTFHVSLLSLFEVRLRLCPS